jgi:2-oxoglutarate ferredoxin oxidoreductase subunit gamma
VPASSIALELGSAAVATMVALGAYVTATDIVDVDALAAALDETLPPYRRQHLGLNEQALRAGALLAPEVVAPAWSAVAA